MPTSYTSRAAPACGFPPVWSPEDLEELADIRRDLDRLDREIKQFQRDLAWDRVITDAIRVCRLLAKVEAQEALKGWRDQPRVPAGNPDGGQWTDGDGNSGAGSDDGVVLSDANPDNDWKPGAQYAQAKKPPGIGHNNPPPGEPQLPEIPEKEPVSKGQISLARAIARYMAATGTLITLEGWALAELWPSIRSSFDAPKSLGDLQARAQLPAEKGYHNHHVAEQTPAHQDGFAWSKINGRENVVRIPEFKHYEITRWYATKNADFGMKSPREFLRNKSWQERTEIGLEALVEKGVLKR